MICVTSCRLIAHHATFAARPAPHRQTKGTPPPPPKAMARTYRRDSRGRFAGGGGGGSQQRVISIPTKASKLRRNADNADKVISRYKDQGRSPSTTDMMERGVMRMRQHANTLDRSRNSKRAIARNLVKSKVNNAKANAKYARRLTRDIREGTGGASNVAILRSEQQSARRQARRELAKARATRSRLYRRSSR